MSTTPDRIEQSEGQPAANGTARPDPGWLPKEFFENQKNIPPELLREYDGLFVAWSWDGTRVVASAKWEHELYQKLEEMGQDTARVVIDYVGEWPR